MKLTQEIEFKQLVQPVMQAVRRRLRAARPLVVLSLAAGEIAYWQNGRRLWQQQFDAAVDSLQDTLRQLLLAQEVEDNAAVVLVPAVADMHLEQLVLPLLPAGELKKAVAWEAQQCVPWNEADFSYTYSSAVVAAGTDDKQCQVQLVALQDAAKSRLQALCADLLLQLQAVCAPGAEDELARQWYAGCALPGLCRCQKQSGVLPVLAPGLLRYLPQAACCLLALALLLYGSMCAGRLWAQHQLTAMQAELKQYAVWEERRQESEARQRQIKKLQGLLSSATAQKISAAASVEQLSSLSQKGVWLTQLQYNGANKPLVVQGRAIDAAALQQQLQYIQQTHKYQRAELLQSAQQGGVVTYKMQLLPQEVKK